MSVKLNPIGLDIGYGYTKAASITDTIIFPSIAGSANHSQFRMSDGSDDLFLALDSREYAVGDTAIKFSRFQQRRESRQWVESTEWIVLAYAALAKCNAIGPARIIAGLPLSYFGDKELVKKRLVGSHDIHTSNGAGIKRKHLEVRDAVIVPQPFGSLLKMVFLPNGKIREEYQILLTGRIGVIDLGSNHTNFLEVVGGDQVAAGSTAIDKGGWDLCRAAKEYLLQQAPNAEFRDHDLAVAIQNGYYKYYGEIVKLDKAVAPMLDDLITEVTATATQYWGSGSDLDVILITGGLAEVVEDEIREFFKPHKMVIAVPEPQMANARGFYAYGQFLNEHG